MLDAAGALSARRYATEGSLVLEVVDEFRPDGAANGRFRLDGGPDGATCVAVDGSVEPDVTLEASVLGSAYLGGVRFTTLATAGRAAGRREDLERADRLFMSTPLPYCNTGF